MALIRINTEITDVVLARLGEERKRYKQRSATWPTLGAVIVNLAMEHLPPAAGEELPPQAKPPQPERAAAVVKPRKQPKRAKRPARDLKTGAAGA
jgi:hypothetical protein